MLTDMHRHILISGCASILFSRFAVAEPLEREQAYFTEVALGTEVGAGPRAVRKWVTNLDIQVCGEPTDADRQALSTVIAELNDLIAPLQVRLTTQSPNVLVYFAPKPQFKEILPEYRPPNLGFHWVSWNEFGEIYEATILIPTTGVSQAERSHIVREELTQSLGLLMDSSRYPDSIFYSGWTTVSEYSDLDRAVIRLLYDPQLEPGTVPDLQD